MLPEEQGLINDTPLEMTFQKKLGQGDFKKIKEIREKDQQQLRGRK